VKCASARPGERGLKGIEPRWIFLGQIVKDRVLIFQINDMT
jgi:hypothetical protein